MTVVSHPSSFRDPSGFIFTHDGVVYRQINQGYREEYDLLITSGLYDRLTKASMMLSHEESGVTVSDTRAYKIIRPTQLPFISYSYEWSFHQLKDAALATLQIQKIALDFGMSLKDASAFNIQFLNAKPVLIDTLSFERFQQEPWVAYKQFCQHFLAPLALMSTVDLSANRLLSIYLDGIPLDLAVRLLPKRFLIKPLPLVHLSLHANSQQKYADAKNSSIKKSSGQFSLIQMKGLIDSLETLIRSLEPMNSSSEWGDYYTKTNYTDGAFEEKKQLVRRLLQDIPPGRVWDLGANAGIFSTVASELHPYIIASDIDPIAVNRLYQEVKVTNLGKIFPLVFDITNPTPDIGWANGERSALVSRVQPDVLLALALIHHIAISNNVPFDRIAAYFASLAPNLIIEFVPKEDSQVQRLLSTRKDIFNQYTQENFEGQFKEHFNIQTSEKVPGTTRTLYLMRRKDA